MCVVYVRVYVCVGVCVYVCVRAVCVRANMCILKKTQFTSYVIFLNLKNRRSEATNSKLASLAHFTCIYR